MSIAKGTTSSDCIEDVTNAIECPADAVDTEITVGATSTAAVALPSGCNVLRVVPNDGMNINIGLAAVAAADSDNLRLISGQENLIRITDVTLQTHYRIIADGAAKTAWISKAR